MKRLLSISFAPCLLMAILVTATGYYHLSRHPTLATTFYFNSPRDYVIAVMLVAGKGFVQPDLDASPELRAFVNVETTAFDLKSLPPDLPTHEADFLQRIREYHIRMLGVIWRVFGISWRYLVGLALIFHVATGFAVYGIMRLTLRRWPSALLTVLVMNTPAITALAPDIRDVSKAPFLLALLWMMGRVIMIPMTVKRLYCSAAIMALFTGVGLGFRQDLVIAIPPSLAILLLFSHGPRLRVKHRTGIVAVYVLMTALAVSPVSWRNLPGGSEYPHNITMGMGAQFSRFMDVAPASYRRMTHSHDFYVFAVPRLFYNRKFGEEDKVCSEAFSVEPEKAFVLANAQTYPADALTRGFASTRALLKGRNLNLGLLGMGLKKAGLILFLLVLTGAAARDTRWAWGLLFITLYFGGYLSLQFSERHYVHYAFAPFWFGATCLAGGLRYRKTFKEALKRLPRGDWRSWRVSRWPLPLRRAVLFFAIALPLAAVPIKAADIVQDHEVGSLVHRNRSAGLTPLETISEKHDNAVEIRLARPLSGGACGVNTADWSGHYLAARFEGVKHPLSLWMQHEAMDQCVDFAGWPLYINIAPETGEAVNVTYYFPVLEGFSVEWDIWLRLRGFVMTKEAHQSFRGLFEVQGAQDFGLWPHMAIPDDLDAFIAHQRIGRRKLIPEPVAEITSSINPYAQVNELMRQVWKLPVSERIAPLREALTKLPNFPTLCYQLAYTLDIAGHYAEARPLYLKALRLRPDFLPAARQIAQHADPECLSDKYVAALEEIAEVLPESPAPHYLIGRAYEYRNCYKQSIAAYEKALALQPGDFAAQQRLARQKAFLTMAIARKPS